MEWDRAQITNDNEVEGLQIPLNTDANYSNA